MKRVILFLLISALSQNVFCQGTENHQQDFPTEYNVFSIPLWSKVVLDLKETNEGKYEYRILSLEPYEKYYSFKNDDNLFEKEPKENTVELFFIGAYYDEGEEDKDYKTLLKIRNNLKAPLDYKADIKYYYKEDFENTSIVGIFPGINTHEIWHHRIDFIALYDFELLKVDEN